MSNRAINMVLRHLPKHPQPNLRVVAIEMAAMVPEDDGPFEYPQAAIADRLGFSVRTIQRCQDVLRELGWLHVVEAATPNSGTLWRLHNGPVETVDSRVAPCEDRGAPRGASENEAAALGISNDVRKVPHTMSFVGSKEPTIENQSVVEGGFGGETQRGKSRDVGNSAIRDAAARRTLGAPGCPHCDSTGWRVVEEASAASALVVDVCYCRERWAPK